ncbi:MAG: alanine--tRNA ligase-related protein [Limisphaerales bacterium]
MPLDAGSARDAATPSAGLVAQQHGQVARATQTAPGATYSRRNLPHFEKPWAIYHVVINTIDPRKLSPAARDIVLDCILHWRTSRYRLVAASVMPDHAHFIIQPGVKEEDPEGQPIFWPLSDLLHSIKSYSAKEVNKLDNVGGTLWQEERYDRYLRSDADLEEKFRYVCDNPWAAGLVQESDPWPWLWTPDIEAWKPYVSPSARQGGTGDSPVPPGDPPGGTGGASPLPLNAGSPTDAATPSAGLVAQRDGQVARATQAEPGGRGGASPWPLNAGSPTDAATPSAGLVAQRDGQVARATPEQIDIDIAFRVIADHIRTLSFSIADGIQPGNNDRNYVLRRILRRAVRYGRTLGFKEPFFYKLVGILAETMGDVFPEIRARQKQVEEAIRVEEEAFNKTIELGLVVFNGFHDFVGYLEERRDVFEREVDLCLAGDSSAVRRVNEDYMRRGPVYAELLSAGRGADDLQDQVARNLDRIFKEQDFSEELVDSTKCLAAKVRQRISGSAAFRLYDTYGFPLDLTELMARERGLTVDVAEFNRLMEEQRARARASQKKTVIELSQIETKSPTAFVGFDRLATPAKVLEVVGLKDKTVVILDTSSCYAEMGGQVGDTGKLEQGASLWRVINTQKSGDTWLHFVEGENLPAPGDEVLLTVEVARRNAIQRHHTVTHLLHWALHEVVSREASQKGSFVGPDKLTFDFNHAPLTPSQVAEVERLVNERIVENAGVSWTEVKHDQVKGRPDVMQFFGDKYGEWVRVVQIGGKPAGLDGYSMELCGGTHTRATGEIGLFRIVGENAIAAGVRRIEAVAGLTAYEAAKLDRELIRAVAGRVNSPVGELEKKIETLLEQQKSLEKQLRAMQQREAAGAARSLLARAVTINGIPAIIENLGAIEGEALQGLVNELKGQFEGVIVLGGAANGAVALIAAVSAGFVARVQAGKLIQQIAPIVGGKGGGKPDGARGGGKDAAKLDEALAKARTLL